VILSTVPDGQAALVSANERFVAVLHPNGMLSVTDRSSGQKLFSVGPFSGCKAPYRLLMMANGQLVLQDKTNTIAWASTSACRGERNNTCYT
jgi:hypothetical protein